MKRSSGSQPTGAGPPPSRWPTPSTIYNGTKLIVDVIQESADVFPPLKSVVGGLRALLKHHDQYIANKGDVQRLVDRVNKLGKSVAHPPRKGDSKEVERREVLARRLQEILSFLNPLVEQGPVSGFFNNVDQATKITGIVEDIRDAITDYQISLQQGLNEQIMTLTETVLLDRLPRASGAGFGTIDRPELLKNFQIQNLSAIENWFQKRDTRQVLWLNGNANTGKTTISRIVTGRLLADGQLGASFFCSRDIALRSDSRSIFPTIAFQLAYTYPEFKAYLVHVLTANPDVGYESLSNQLSKLLIEPLYQTLISTVVVIDALDECKETQSVSTILSLLSSELVRIPRVKFFIASRPEAWIRSGFQLPDLKARLNTLQLQEIVKPDIVGGPQVLTRRDSSRDVPYSVVFHQSSRVNTLGFSKEKNARLFYDALSDEWARILVKRHHPPEVLLSHGGDHWVEYCKAEVLRPSSIQEADLLHGLYIVAFHRKGRVRMISLATEDIARSVYDTLSKDWAKVLVDRGQDNLLSSHGNPTYIRECQKAVQKMNSDHDIVPIWVAQFVIAYHQSGRVSLIGFGHQPAAEAVYEAIPDKWAKILVSRLSNKLLLSYGTAHYVNQCKEETMRLVPNGQ